MASFRWNDSLDSTDSTTLVCLMMAGGAKARREKREVDVHHYSFSILNIVGPFIHAFID